jgi:prefoldin subunit 5
MEKVYNMKSKEEIDKVVKIIKECKQSSNKDLQYAMDFINEDFEHTKSTLIKLTHHLDKLDNSYNLLLKEYQNRNNINVK